jgi:deoxyguanosine kinase
MLVVVEGCVGAGKSTVAKGLAAYRKSKVLLEAFEDNPFLPAFYEDPIGNALETEFAFLLLHFHQLKSHKGLAANHELISDFHLAKDLVYADLNLMDARLKHTFRELYDLLNQQVPPPSVMICLSAPTELIVRRIRARKRDFELKIDLSYYSNINAAYERFFECYKGRKVRIRMEEWDFVERPELYAKLSSLVDE